MKRERQYRGGYQFAGMVERARALRNQQTSAESFLWGLLRNRQLLGFKFRRQHQFGDYIVDFFCRDVALAIECDGSAHDGNEHWHHDQTRDAYFIGHGIRVLRFSNEQVLNNTVAVLEEIARRLPSPLGRGVGGEGLSAVAKPSPHPSPKGRGR